MKITHHKDGTYSITGMTRDDLDDIYFGTMLAHHWSTSDERRRDPDMLAWNRARGDEFAKLETVLRDAVESSFSAEHYGSHYLPAGRSITLRSDAYRTDPGRWDVIEDGRRKGKGAADNAA